MSGEAAIARGTGAVEDTLDEILAQLRRLVPVDAAAFLSVDPRRRWIRPAAQWFASDEARRALEPLLSRRYEPERPGLTEAVIESGEPVLIDDLGAWPAAQRMRDRMWRDLSPEQAELSWAWYARAALIACPVATSDGRSLGVLVLSSTPPTEPLRRSHLGAIRAFADLAAVAIDRAWLLDAEARRSRDELLLGRAAAATTESLDLETVYERILEQASLLTGAGKALLARYVPATESLHVVASRGFSDEVVRARFALGEGMIGRVAASRVPYRSRARHSHQHLQWVVEREAIGSFLHVPIELGPRLFGVLNVSDEDPERLGEEGLALLVRYAQAAAGAIANATEHAHERRLVHALARGFVPAEPGALPGIELSVHYEPSGRQASGGDVYGVWPTGTGRVAFLVGDVAGHGLEVASLASMVRFFVEARAWDTASPADVLRQTDDLLRGRLPPDRFATAWLGVLAGDTLHCCTAGHEPPVLVDAAGSVRALPGSGPPLGVEHRPALRDVTVRLAPGELLVAWTDGVTESRRDGEPLGAARVAAALGALEAPPSAAAATEAVAALARSWAGTAEDDVTVLAARRTPRAG